MNMIENLGFDFVMESEENYMGFLAKVCEDGKAITGYYGYPYLNLEYGDSQFVARTQMTEEEKLEVVGMDTHVPGRAIWEVLLSDVNFQPKDADPLSRRVVVKRASDGGGMAVVNLINADVLPSFWENEKVKMQMIAFPEMIHYYADEEAYAADQPEGANGKKWLLADGSMIATGIFSNHGVDNPDNDKDHYSDNYMLIRGTVKGFIPSIIKIGGQEIRSYIRTHIATEHGDLEIVHTIDQVDGSEHENLRAGAVVNGLFIWEAGKKGKPCNPSYFGDQFKASLATIPGMPQLTPHCCRVTYVSIMQALGVKLETISHLVGHTTTRITESRYLRVQNEACQDALDRFDERFRFEA